jgi:hypothetical protein
MQFRVGVGPANLPDDRTFPPFACFLFRYADIQLLSTHLTRHFTVYGFRYFYLPAQLVNRQDAVCDLGLVPGYPHFTAPGVVLLPAHFVDHIQEIAVCLDPGLRKMYAQDRPLRFIDIAQQYPGIEVDGDAFAPEMLSDGKMIDRDPVEEPVVDFLEGYVLPGEFLKRQPQWHIEKIQLPREEHREEGPGD